MALSLPASAQVTIPYTFTAGTTIRSAEVNSNFSTLGTNALNRAGGTVTGAITSSGGSLTGSWAGAPTFTGNLTFSGNPSFTGTGTGLAVTNNATVGGTLAVTGAVTGGTYNGQTISSAASLTGTLVVTGATTLSSTLAVTGAATFSAVNTYGGFGTHVFSAGGTGANAISVRNTTAGTGNYSQIRALNDLGDGLDVRSYSSMFTSSSYQQARGASIMADSGSTGGLSIGALNASGEVRFYAGGNFLTWKIDTSSRLAFGGGAAGQIVQGTSDGSDNGYMVITAGGVFDTTGARGAYAQFFGNENADAGDINMQVGNVSGAQFNIYGGGGSAWFRLTGANGSINYTSNVGSTMAFVFQQSSPLDPFGIDSYFSGTSPNGTSNYFYRGRDTSGTRFEVRSNGGIANYSANNVNLSDASTKDILGATESLREQFRRVAFVNARYKDAPASPLDVMVTAQNIQTIWPDLITEFADGKLGVREHGLVMRGLRVVQELDAALLELAARVEALEAR